MPKVHSIGPLFVQQTKFPYTWKNKIFVRGWTQEIEPPYRTSKPLIVRLPFNKALVFGLWTGRKTEEEALNSALERRDVTYDDFTQEAGWTPAPDSDGEKSGENFYSRPNPMDGTLDVRDRQESDPMAKN